MRISTYDAYLVDRKEEPAGFYLSSRMPRLTVLTATEMSRINGRTGVDARNDRSSLVDVAKYRVKIFDKSAF